MNPLRISLCQYDIAWENAGQNRLQLEKMFSGIKANSIDLIILPEMFSTGFSMNSAALAESMEGPTIKWMQQISNELNTAICGSLIIHDDTNFKNRLLWIAPHQKQVQYYDKKHLFTLAGEQEHYSAGSEQLIIEWRTWKLGFYICYDLRFPVWSRNTQNLDLMIYVANFPEKRELAWNRLLPARAIENQCFVAGVNRIGKDGNGIVHRGDSSVYDFEGSKILDLGSIEQISTITLDPHPLEVYRRAYPFLKDRDMFELK